MYFFKKRLICGTLTAVACFGPTPVLTPVTSGRASPGTGRWRQDHTTKRDICRCGIFFLKNDNHNLLSDIKNYFNRVQSSDTQQMFKIPKVLIRVHTCFLVLKKKYFSLIFFLFCQIARFCYFQIYDRSSGDVVYEMLTMEGSGFQDVAVSESWIVALLTIKHKLLSCKVI